MAGRKPLSVEERNARVKCHLTLASGHRVRVIVEHDRGQVAGVFLTGDYLPILDKLTPSQRRTCERAVRRLREGR